MGESFIPESLQRLWSVWNIRGFMILSLFLQVLLASTAQLRKKSSNRLIIFVIWSAYFMADWAATFTFGLISMVQHNDSVNPPEVNENLLALWAAFLLIHLGGPDTITAFSLEDNALWMRHLVGLVAQLSVFLYIFLKSLPHNNLAVPTILIAVAGAIKYGERTRALYLASLENLKKSIVKLPDTSIDDSYGYLIHNGMPLRDIQLVQIFKGLVVDIRPNHAERSASRELFLREDAEGAFDIMLRELGFLYKMFYTKILAINSGWGILTRIITYYNVVVALVLYCLSTKEGFHEVDISITYLLLAGFVVLDAISGIMLAASSSTDTPRWYHYVWIATQYICFFIPGMAIFQVVNVFRHFSAVERFMKKSWCEKLGAFNLLSHCFGQYQRGGNRMKKYAHIVSRFFTAYGDISWNAFDDGIQNFIFHELKGRAEFANDADKVNTIFVARGGWVLTNLGNNTELMKYVNRFDYDRSLLAWHLATEICYNTDGAVDGAEREHMKLAKILSDYMHYLLTKKPEMMSAVAGIGHIRYRDTCAEVIDFCRVFESKTANEFYVRVTDELTTVEPAHVYKDNGTSVLSDACNLAKVLRQKDKRWEIISRVWVEVLMYAAGHCRPERHVRALSEGGELVTIVWLLMSHMGIVPHFPYPED